MVQNFTQIDFSSPPLLQQFSDEDIIDALKKRLQIPKVPCHTQSVERAIRLLKEAVIQYQTYESRHGHMLATLQSRNNFGTFDSKHQYRA